MPSDLFGYFKRAPKTFNFRLNEPFLNILGQLVRYDHPWEKTTKTNIHRSVIFLLAKVQNSTFCRWKLETYMVLRYAGSDGVIFTKNSWLLKGGLLLYENQTNFSDSLLLVGNSRMYRFYIFGIDIISRINIIIYGFYIFGINIIILLIYLLISKFRFLEFWLLWSHIIPYLQALPRIV